MDSMVKDRRAKFIMKKREVSKVSERQFEDHRLRELEMPKEELKGISTSSSDDVCGRSTVASILLFASALL